MPVMSTFGGASQRQSGKSNHQFRPPVNLTAVSTDANTYSNTIQFTWVNLNRQSGRSVMITMNGVEQSFYVTTQQQTGSMNPYGGNSVAAYSGWTFFDADQSRRTLNSPNGSVVYKPLIPTLLPPSWNDYGLGFYQEGWVYSGGGQTRATIAAMPGTVTINITKNGSAFASNVTLPYTLTHSGSNNVLATYVFNLIGSAGGTNSRTWYIQPRTATSQYVISAQPPNNGDQQGTMAFNNFQYYNFPNSLWTVNVRGQLEGTCYNCGGCTQVLTNLDGGSQANTQSQIVYINTFYYRGDGASDSTAQFMNMWYMVVDQMYNGEQQEATFYGSFGSYTLYPNC